MSAPSTLLDAAVWYCENGFAIIPLKPRGKRPISKNGLNDWFDNPEDARKLWTQHPDLNIGVVCGVPSHGLVVLDVDEDDEEDKHGLDTLDEWESMRGELPRTATAITGRGGLHYLYRTDRTNIRPSANGELHVDVRADGGYIVAPPSVHPNGNVYHWDVGCAPWEIGVQDANGNVYDFLDHVQRNGGKSDDAPRTEAFQLPEVIKMGERDDTLYRYGCSLRSRGERDDVIAAMVEKANRDRCEKKMPQRDIDRIVASVCKRGPGHDGEGLYNDETPPVGRPGRGGGVGAQAFRAKNGTIKPNLLARVILSENHAQHIDGAPAVWTGRRWEFGKPAFERIILDHADDASTNQRNEVFSYIQARAPQVSSDNGFDGRYYVQFADVTLDVMRREAVEPNPSMLIIGTLPINYNPDAPYGLADEFIASLAAGDEVIERVLFEIIAACMCSKRIVAQSPMLIGRAGTGPEGAASNGKSTFINVVRNLLGPENTSSLDVATMGQRFQAADLAGKLANLGDDIPDGFLHNDELAVFKKVITGETIRTDVKNGKAFTFRPSATQIFSMNQMPRLADTTDGIYRRLKFVSFMARFSPGMPNYNMHMAEDMSRRENLERLATLALMTLPELIDRGTFTEIPAMEAEMEQVRIDNDIVRRWLYECGLDASDLDGRWTDDAYTDFKNWADQSGEKYTVTKSTFTKKILATLAPLEVSKTRDRRNGRNGRKFKIAKNPQVEVEG